jgi:hypothetical protein
MSVLLLRPMDYNKQTRILALESSGLFEVYLFVMYMVLISMSRPRTCFTKAGVSGSSQNDLCPKHCQVYSLVAQIT